MTCSYCGARSRGRACAAHGDLPELDDHYKEEIVKKKEVVLGRTYRAKVSGTVCDVRVTSVHSAGGWWAVNLSTNRVIHIRSAQRLRSPLPVE